MNNEVYREEQNKLKIKIHIFLLLNVTSCKNSKNQAFLLPYRMSLKKKNNHFAFFNTKIILGLKSFKGMLCTVIEIKKGFQRDYKLIQCFTLPVYTMKQLKKKEWIILGYFERFNFVKFQSNFLIQEPNINRHLLLFSLRSPMFAIIYSF